MIGRDLKMYRLKGKVSGDIRASSNLEVIFLENESGVPVSRYRKHINTFLFIYLFIIDHC